MHFLIFMSTELAISSLLVDAVDSDEDDEILPSEVHMFTFFHNALFSY